METTHLRSKLVLCGKPHGKLTINTNTKRRRARQLDGRLIRQYLTEDWRVFNTDGEHWWEVKQEHGMTGAA